MPRTLRGTTRLLAVADVQRLAATGLSQRQIGIQLGLTGGQVERICTDFAIKTGPGAIPVADKATGDVVPFEIVRLREIERRKSARPAGVCKHCDWLGWLDDLGLIPVHTETNYEKPRTGYPSCRGGNRRPRDI